MSFLTSIALVPLVLCSLVRETAAQNPIGEIQSKGGTVKMRFIRIGKEELPLQNLFSKTSGEGLFLPSQIINKALAKWVSETVVGLLEKKDEPHAEDQDMSNGVFINSNGEFLTARHIVYSGCRPPKADSKALKSGLKRKPGKGVLCPGLVPFVTKDGKRQVLEDHKLEVLRLPKWAKYNDFALLRIKGYSGKNYLRISPTEPKIDESVLGFAYSPPTRRKNTSELISDGYYKDVPRGGDLRVTVGRVVRTKWKMEGSGHPDTAVHAVIDGLPGFSGSPLVNAYGELIGILKGPGCPSKGFGFELHLCYLDGSVLFIRASKIKSEFDLI